MAIPTNLDISSITYNGTVIPLAGGVTPSGTRNISDNGDYDVTEYATAHVSVPTGQSRSSSDVTASGGTVTVPAGLYSTQVKKNVASGSVDDPVITKSISGTTATLSPKVTIHQGYVLGTTKLGQQETVTASELETLGTKSITENGNDIDVVGYSAVNVNVQGSGVGMIPPFAYRSSAISSFTSNANLILNDAFRDCPNLTAASFPMAGYIGNYAFNTCFRLTTATFPMASYIGSSAFAYCSRLTTASFPMASYIAGYAFFYCSSLTTVSFPIASYIGEDAFYSCTRLTTVSFPMASYIGSYAFYNCYSLTTVSFPAASYIGNYAFQSCSKLTTASFPMAGHIGSGAFASCYRLTTASFPMASNISSSAFAYCHLLTSLYLLSTSVCNLSASNAFTTTPIGGYSTSAGQFGSVFVPASLVDAYKSATNWSYFSSRITAYVE